MRRLAAATIVLLAVAAPAPAALADGPRLERWRPGLERARDYADTRTGTIGFAVRTRHRLYRSDAYRSYSSASVVKAMLMVAYLNHASVRHRPLGDGDRALLAPMVRWSDNVAASQIRNLVGNGALEHIADRVGMARFVAAPSWGSSQITAAGQTKLFLRIDRQVVRRHRRYAMRLLGSIVPEQRWGVARVPHPGWALYFKSGWGSGSGAIDHQVALLRRGRRRIALAVLTSGSPTHAYATETQREIARRLLRGLGPRSRPR